LRCGSFAVDCICHETPHWLKNACRLFGDGGAAGVAHEIRNPLTAIKMLIYSLREELANDDEKRQDLAVILKEIDRLEHFVHNFLQFARPPEPVLNAVNVNETVHETLILLTPRLRQNRIEVREAYQPNLEKLIADADQVQQVAMNLVLNAVQSMPEGGQLTAETRRAQISTENHGNDWVRIRISDTGCGIPKELLDSIFDPFVSGRKDGIGLGLSVAYQIMHRHGGWIEKESQKASKRICSKPLAPSRRQESPGNSSPTHRRQGSN
jgi:signal transduction histidine kinase